MVAHGAVSREPLAAVRAHQQILGLISEAVNDLLTLVGVAVSAILAAGLVWAARRATELFAVRIEHGRATHLRGRIPPALFSEIADVCARPPVERATLRAVLHGGTPALEITGAVSEAQAQRLRNVLGRFPAARIRSGRMASRGP
jgi:hypothetical protein